MTQEIAELQKLVAEKQAQLAVVTDQLRPYWHRQTAIKEAIKATHRTINSLEAENRGLQVRNWNSDRHVVGLELGPEPVKVRADLFAELDRLAEVYGPTRNLYRELKLEVESTQRAIERIKTKDKASWKRTPRRR